MPDPSPGPARRRHPDPTLRVRRADSLFERDEPARPAEPAGGRKAFREHLRATPAAPLPPALRAGLWVAGIVVALLFGLALWKMSQKRPAARAVGSAASLGRATILAGDHTAGDGLIFGISRLASPDSGP